jgi:uncharacterized protein YaaR (DUF327 family)
LFRLFAFPAHGEKGAGRFQVSIGFQEFADAMSVQVRLKTGAELRRRSISTSSSSNAAALDNREKSASFLDILAEVIPASTPEKASLQALWSQMPQVERDLLSSQSRENVEKYKELVRSIAQATLEQNMKVETSVRRSRLSGDEKQLTTVRILDERLHQMAVLMRSPSNSAFALLGRLTEIRGLLMDMRR